MRDNDALDDELTGAFVLAASLYFQSCLAAPQDGTPTGAAATRDRLHALCCDLLRACETARPAGRLRIDLGEGIEDLLSCLSDLADLAARNRRRDLADRIVYHREQFGEQPRSWS
ncbi:MAG: hypothetical protein AAFR28_17385 [Pseudomonadota bacterium]